MPSPVEFSWGPRYAKGSPWHPRTSASMWPRSASFTADNDCSLTRRLQIMLSNLHQALHGYIKPFLTETCFVKNFIRGFFDAEQGQRGIRTVTDSPGVGQVRCSFTVGILECGTGFLEIQGRSAAPRGFRFARFVSTLGIANRHGSGVIKCPQHSRHIFQRTLPLAALRHG